jgi:hypothetical protein
MANLTNGIVSYNRQQIFRECQSRPPSSVWETIVGAGEFLGDMQGLLTFFEIKNIKLKNIKN